MKNFRSRFLKALEQKRFIVGAFRILALLLAIIQLSLDSLAPSNSSFVGSYLLPPAMLIVGAALYTCFKLIHPLSLYRSGLSSVILVALDISTSASDKGDSGGSGDRSGQSGGEKAGQDVSDSAFTISR